MNTQSSPIRIFSIIALLIVALVGVYFSLNKNINILPTNLTQVGTSTNSNATTTANIPNQIGKPVITKLDMPQALNVDQKGTWTVYASSTDGKGLSYSAVWGDEVIADPTAVVNLIKQVSPTFTHSYSYPGVYNPVITIYGSTGESVYASVGARVIGETKKAPIVYSLSPSSATAGSLITINGAGFTPPKSVPNGPGTMPSNEVLFDGTVLAGVTSNGVNNLYFMIPNDAKLGKHTLEVKNLNGKSNAVKVIVSN